MVPPFKTLRTHARDTHRGSTMTLQRVFVSDTHYVSTADISAAIDHLTMSEQEELITKVLLLGGTFDRIDDTVQGVPAWTTRLDGRRATSVHRYSIERAAAEFLILYGVLPNTGPV